MFVRVLLAWGPVMLPPHIKGRMNDECIWALESSKGMLQKAGQQAGVRAQKKLYLFTKY